jgi:hypothetical protein
MGMGKMTIAALVYLIILAAALLFNYAANKNERDE